MDLHPPQSSAKPPKYVIFDLREVMANYERHIAKMNQAEIDLEYLFNDVINRLRFSYYWPGELVALASDFVAGNAHWMGDDVEHLEAAIMELGNGIHTKLCRNRMYDESELHHYVLHGLDRNNALVLSHEDSSDLVAF